MQLYITIDSTSTWRLRLKNGSEINHIIATSKLLLNDGKTTGVLISDTSVCLNNYWHSSVSVVLKLLKKIFLAVALKSFLPLSRSHVNFDINFGSTEIVNDLAMSLL